MLPLRRKPGSEESPDEQLEQVLSLKGFSLPKGSTKTLKYGPVCRAGAHVVSVTLNGAHVVGSPLHVTISPAAPEPRMCLLRPPGAASATAANSALAAAGYHGSPPAGVRTHTGETTKEIVLGVQLRDRYGNKCADDRAAEFAAELASGALSILVRRQKEPSRDDDELDHSIRGLLGKFGKHDTDFDPGTHEPLALLPSEGSAAYEDRVSSRVAVAAEEASGGGSARGGLRRGPRATEAAVALKTGPVGLLTVRLNIARAGVHLVSCALRGELLPSMVVLVVRPGPAVSSACTAHDVIESERTALTRCIAGVPRQLRLVARDAHGNATSFTSLHKWSIEARAGKAGLIEDENSDLSALDETRPLGFSSQIELSDTFTPATALLTYRLELPGEHELLIRFGNRPIRSSPSPIRVLMPAWGPGLAAGVAGEHAIVYVRLRPEGAAVPGSADARRLMHALAVEAVEKDSREVAVVNTRMVQIPEPAHAGSAAAGAGTGEVAEVSLLCATSSNASWSLTLSLDGRPVLGSPFSWRVAPGQPSIERCLLHAPWVGTRSGAAGVRHEGILVLRDRTGNECEADPSRTVNLWIREEFVVRDTPACGSDSSSQGTPSRGAKPAYTSSIDLEYPPPPLPAHAMLPMQGDDAKPPPPEEKCAQLPPHRPIAPPHGPDTHH